MHHNESIFLKKAQQKAFDLNHRKTIQFNMGRYNAAVPKGKEQFVDIDFARKKAKNIKWKAIEQLDQMLLQFEKQITQKGAEVIWAETAQDALQAIQQICELHHCKTLVKSKSMVTEEVHLNSFLEKLGIESIETDLGEYIQQLSGEPPYHIVTPAMHKNKAQIAALFAEKLSVPQNLPPEQLTRIAREMLRKKYAEAEVGVTGGNFLIADIGGVAVTENEGNARLSTALPPVHIVLVGIEKIIPSIHDLALFWPLLATYGTGQFVTVYNTIFTGPRQKNEVDGPQKMYVILLDNGRTNLLKDIKTRESAYCIRCGACLNACPIYKNIGGHTYNTTYSGPIGSVITPLFKGMPAFKHLSFASSLCGNCTEVCPVKINLHELLLHNRYTAVAEGNSSWTEQKIWQLWAKASLHRGMYNMTNGYWKTKFINLLLPSWTKYRGSLQFPKKSFNQLWKQKNKK